MSERYHLTLLASSLLVACLWIPAPAFADKTDAIVLQNGDRITGEIKSLDRGILKFSTDHIGTIEVEWEFISTVKSKQVLDVELKSGQRFFGSLETEEESGQLLVRSLADVEHEIPMFDTVRMTPLDETGKLRERVDGYVDIGYSSTKSTDVIQWDFGAGFSFRDRVRLWTFDFSSTLSDSGTTENGTTKLSGQFQRFFGNRWFWAGVLQFEQNDAQGVDLRSTLGGAMGRNLLQTNHQLLSLTGGLGYSREDLADGTQLNSTEGIIGLNYDAFIFDDPELNFSAQFVVFPSFTISGRVRGQTDISLSYEIIGDLYIDLSLTGSFDNEPQTEGALKSDYTISTSLGYSF